MRAFEWLRRRVSERANIGPKQVSAGSELAFISPDTWTGGFYELAMELEGRDDAVLRRFLNVLWGHPALDGPYARHDREPSEQLRFEPEEWAIGGGTHLYGVATLPDGKPIPCGCWIRIGGDEPDTERDAVSLYLPMGALARADRSVGEFPFGDAPSRSWREPLDAWLVGIGTDVYRAAGFGFARIGFEVDDFPTEDDLRNGRVPGDRQIACLIPAGPELCYYPVTNWR